MRFRRGVALAGAVLVAGSWPVPAPAGADTVLTLAGTSLPSMSGTDPWNLPYTGGDPEVSIPYPASPLFMDWSVGIGVRMAMTLLDSIPGDKTLVGISQGALVIGELKAQLMALPEDRRPGPVS